MPKPAFQHVERLFHEVVDLPKNRRQAFLDDACAGDADLRAAVEELLRHDESSADTDRFLVSPVTEAAAQLRPTMPAQSNIVEIPNIPGYEILGDLGRGGMGIVYKAKQLNLNRVVAIKMLLQSELAAPEQLTRFKSEAEILARLQHPNIIPIYDVGSYVGRPYFTMEFVNGPSLAKYQGSRPIPPSDAANLLEILARAMHIVHQHGIIHRDLKPSNILLQVANAKPPTANEQSDVQPTPVVGANGFQTSIPKITDFGVAKDRQTQQDITQAGVMMGTPSYMAPEQARGRPSDVNYSADIYSLGAVLYEMLTGRPPFEAATSAETIVELLNDPPPPPTRFVADLPRDLVTICLKCLEKSPDRRYANAWELAEDLRRFQCDEPIHARPVSWLEKTIRWCRRHPLAAALSGLCGLLVLTFAITVAIYESQLRDALAQKTALAELERKQIVQLNIILGGRDHEAGDLFSAALRFAEALRLDDSVNGPAHRNRIDDVLKKCPRLVDIHQLNQKVIGSLVTATAILAVTIDDQNRVQIRDAATGNARGPSVQLPRPAVEAALSQDGRWLVAIHPDGLAQLCNMVQGSVRDFADSSMQKLKAARFTTSTTIVTHHEDSTARQWDLSSGNLEPKNLPESVRVPTTCTDGRWHLALDADGAGRLIELATGETKATIQLVSGIVQTAISSQGDYVAGLLSDQTCRIWRVNDGQAVPLVHRLEERIVHLQFSPDGQQILLMDAAGTTRIWESQTTKPLTPPLRNAGRLAAVGYDATNGRVIMTKANGEIRIWSLTTETMHPAQPSISQSMEEMIAKIQLHAHGCVNDQQQFEVLPAEHVKKMATRGVPVMGK